MGRDPTDTHGNASCKMKEGTMLFGALAAFMSMAAMDLPEAQDSRCLGQSGSNRKPQGWREDRKSRREMAEQARKRNRR